MRARAGIVLLILVVLIVLAFSVFHHGSDTAGPGNPGAPTSGPAPGAAPIALKGYVGGEKLDFLQDPDVVKILQTKYGITVDADKRGSMEMVQEASEGKDFLWPSNEIALTFYRQKNPSSTFETIFNSPIVIYSWDRVTDALVKQGVVKKEADAYYIVDFKKLVGLMDHEATWQSLGLDQLHGKLLVYSTDPGKSSSGNLFAALLADTLTGDDVSDAGKLRASLPTIKRFFDKQGFMLESSKDLFQEFLSRGMGNKQLVIGYEAQLIEADVADPQSLASRQNAVRTLYPRPTVWSAHPLIALTENGKRLIPALKDPQIQEIAWRKHGFRSATGAANDPKANGLPGGIPATIENTVQLPTPAAMQTVEKAIEGR